MGSVNRVILVGNLGRDAEVRHTANGQAVATLNLATTENWKDKEGQRQEKTEWHRVVVWGKTAEALGQYLTKGKQIAIEGRIETRQWDDKDGNKRYTTEIKADRVTLLGRRRWRRWPVGWTGARIRRPVDPDERACGHAGRRHPVLSRRPARGAPAAGLHRFGLPGALRPTPSTIVQGRAGPKRPGRYRADAAPDVERWLHIESFMAGALRPRPYADDETVNVSGSSSVSIFQPNDIVQLRRRHLEHVAVLDRRHAVHRAWCDVEWLPR